MSDASYGKLTPVLMVEAIEPCLALWVDRLGWTQTVAVPEGDRLGFVILEKDGVELMYQSWESVEKDLAKPVKRSTSPSIALFIEVSDIEDIVRRVHGLPLAVARRKTFYGTDEIGVTEAGGHLVLFAQPGAA